MSKPEIRLGMMRISPVRAAELISSVVTFHDGRTHNLEFAVKRGLVKVYKGHYALWDHDGEAVREQYRVDELGDGGETHKDLQAIAMKLLTTQGYDPELEINYSESSAKIADVGDVDARVYVECGNVGKGSVLSAVGLNSKGYGKVSLNDDPDSCVNLLILLPFQTGEAHYISFYGLIRGEVQ